MARRLTVLFMPESAYGPTNNCIGIGAALRRRGHRVVFASESSWRGRLEPLGFEEDLVDLAPPSDPLPGAGTDAGAGAFWADFVRETAPAFRLPAVEQLAPFVRPTWQALVDGARYVQGQLEAVLDRVRPDVVVEDNVCAFPALVTAGVPFVRIVSCNPLEIGSPALPPKFSGYPVDDDTAWQEFRARYDELHRDLWEEFDDWVRSLGAPPLPDLEFIHESAAANLYVYPAVADYSDRRALGASWHRLESCVRETEGGPTDELTEFLERQDGAVVYLSLGSLGSADVALMQRLVDVLSPMPHRFVVSKGPLADRYDLPANMWGASQVPQTRVLPYADLVITHGGNNTATECFHFGKPMIALPLFWDQHDNAQRIAETGFGRRLPTYDHDADELRDAVDELLANETLRTRAAGVGASIRAACGVTRAAALVEDAARRSSG